MESDLSLTLTAIEAEIGFFLGYGRGENYDDTAWTTQQQQAISAAVRSGLRQFYIPEPIDGASYAWSFLMPTTTKRLLSGLSTLNLPDDFGHAEGMVTLASDTNSCYEPVRITGEGRVSQAYARDATSTGTPTLIAVRPIRGTSADKGQRFQFYVWPAADQDYDLTFAYTLLPNALSGERPYAYGGMLHAETILAACKMAAEETLDDVIPGQGVWSLKFRARLAASIDIDRRNKPQHLGPNLDRSDDLNGWPYSRRQREATVTFNGIDPG